MQATDIRTQVNENIAALMAAKEHAYTIGFLQSQLYSVIEMLPKSKQQAIVADMTRTTLRVISQ